MEMKLIVILICGELLVFGSAYQQCNIICDENHIPSPSLPNVGLPGKAGPKGHRGEKGRRGERGEIGGKGEKGENAESCDCSSLDEIREEMTAMKKELQQLKGKPRDCYVIKQAFPLSLSGVYTIFPSFDDINGIQVYCDMVTDGGGWIVFQSRYDGSVDFYRNWDEYVQGFGELTGEFWLGLETVHQLTRNGNFNLRIDLTDFEENSVYAHYSSFSIGEGDGYVLDYNEYSGTAGGDGLLKTKFTTKDRDQDTWSRNCAVVYQGAYWYTACHNSNLNGLYLRGWSTLLASQLGPFPTRPSLRPTRPTNSAQRNNHLGPPENCQPTRPITNSALG